ncbi:MAG TPA: choice-of-anchor Q domain-containing protein, partial [Anaerolineae bacterium]|nr:choice-of-anchor Q domain-containing protein [Anaerolineae bacterium]
IWGGDITLTNSIVANNGGTNNFKMYQGDWFSQGYNLSNDWNGLPLHTSDKTGDPLLGPLEDNDGATWTHALSINSLAVDQVPHGVNGCGTLYTQDQRGKPRPYQAGGRCDTGAFEARDLIWYVYALMPKDELP